MVIPNAAAIGFFTGLLANGGGLLLVPLFVLLGLTMPESAGTSLVVIAVLSRPLAAIPQVTVHELRSRLDAGEVTVLDVRQPAEWAAGHIPGAAFVAGADLPSCLNDVPDAAVVATVCGSGYRSSVASSLLAARGRAVINVLGGMAAWNNAHYPNESQETRHGLRQDHHLGPALCNWSA